MGYLNRTKQETTVSNNSSSLSEALLFATMCIIGLPVEVFVKDGSVYSGIFYTASVEKDYGIVLKKAKMTKKGKSNVNVANGTVIETLVILSADLVQVVAKGVQLPADGIAGNYAGDDVEVVAGTVSSIEGQINELKGHIRSGMDIRHNQKRISDYNENGFFHGDGPTKAEKEHDGKKLSLNNIRKSMEVEHRKRDENGIDVTKIEEASVDSINRGQVGDERSQGQQDLCTRNCEFHREENVDGVQGSSSNNNQCCERPTSADSSSLDAAQSSVSTFSNPVTDVSLGLCSSSSAASIEVIPPQSSQSNKSSKEFKLNPGARIFSPTFTNPKSATPPAIQTVTSMVYMPSNSPVLPVNAARSEVGISPYVSHSSVPAKFVPYGNLAAGNGGSAVHFSQPIVGHGGQYPVQAGHTYVHPNSQAVMFGRVGGQLVYMQPVSNDLVRGVAAISQVSARPALAPHQLQFPKHQGNAAGQGLQLRVPSPLVAVGMQPLSVPSHMPVLQPPIPANRPIPVPGSNGSKFL